MRIALDTNVLAYAAGVNGEGRQLAALELLGKLSESETVLPVQALGELFRVLVRKAKISPRSARTTIIRFRDTYPLVETSSAVFLSATDLAVDHQIGIWDAVMLAAAAEAGCRLFLSEDLQEGFTWDSVTVVNPFAAMVHPLLAKMLEP
ncbi:MAG TPA: PIN domain-containing protein [Candidatus Sulfotelmatobacter sp.]|jgi:predicted nucleic acid-binding protein|nr:PIN domain-containing protein [Candidatus Sulfotelmatobacter sp.]